MEVHLTNICTPAAGLLEIPAWFIHYFIFVWVVVHSGKLIEPFYSPPGNAHLLIAFPLPL